MVDFPQLVFDDYVYRSAVNGLFGLSTIYVEDILISSPCARAVYEVTNSVKDSFQLRVLGNFSEFPGVE